MNWPPVGSFDVSPPKSGWTTDWSTSVQQQPSFEQKEEDKRAYGVELAKLNAVTEHDRVNAAVTIFGRLDGNKVMWVVHNWHLDPVTIQARESYVPPPKPLLDKEALAAKLLECADEKIERNGQKIYVNEAKDRLGFLNLYSKIMGFTDQPNHTSTNFVNNEMKVVLVKPAEKQEIKPLKVVQEVVEETTSITPLRIKAV